MLRKPVMHVSVLWVSRRWESPRCSVTWQACTPRWRPTSSPPSPQCPGSFDTKVPKSRYEDFSFVQSLQSRTSAYLTFPSFFLPKAPGSAWNHRGSQRRQRQRQAGHRRYDTSLGSFQTFSTHPSASLAARFRTLVPVCSVCYCSSSKVYSAHPSHTVHCDTHMISIIIISDGLMERKLY